MQHPFGPAADVHRLPVGIFFSFFLPFFCFAQSAISASCLRSNVWVSFIFIQLEMSAVLAGITLVPDSRNQPEEFRHAAERIDCSASVVRVRCDFKRAVVYFVGNVDLYFGVNALNLIMKRCLQTSSESETRTGLARDWKINACRFGRHRRRGKSCNQSLESRL